MVARIKLIESPSEKKDYYVYVVFRPNWIPCYIGKGRRHRWLMHFRKWNNYKNPHLAAIIKNAGGNLPVLKIQEGLSNRRAAKLEIDFIRIIGREMNGGPLVNQTDGGDGVVGKSPERCERQRQLMLGRKASEETRLKMSLAQKGKKHNWTVGALENIAKAQRGRKQSEAERAKRSASAKRRLERDGNTFLGKHHTEESKAKMSASKIGRKHTEEHKKKIGDAMRGKTLTESHRLAITLSWIARREKEYNL